MRVFVYVDGFNLYYRGLRKTPYKWLDLLKLSKNLLDPQDTIEKIRYFTADVSPRSGDPEAPLRQQTYFRALKTIPQLEIHKGRFLPKTKMRPLVVDPSIFVEVHDTEEKGSDVNLASHLLNDGFNDRFDLALVITQDTDLCEPIKMIKDEIGKIAGVIWTGNSNPGKRYRAVASFIRHAHPSLLARCQFPDPIVGMGGRLIAKPPSW